MGSRLRPISALCAVVLLAATAPPRDPNALPNGGAASLAVTMGGGARTIRLTFRRTQAADGTSHAFDVVPDGIELTLIDRENGRRRIVRGSGEAARSHRAGRERARAAGDGADVATVAFPLGRDVPASYDRVEVRNEGGLRDGDDLLRVDGSLGTHDVNVPPYGTAAAAEVAALRTRYGGRRVALYGDEKLTCARYPTDEYTMASARVTGIRRASGTSAVLRFGADASQEPDRTYLALDPIVVDVAEAPAGSVSRGFAIEGDPVCSRFRRTVAATWELERVASPRSPAERGWSAGVLRAIGAGTVIPGMTPEMAAFAWDYPPQYGTKAALERLTRWNYPEPAPFAKAVTFRDGRAISVRPPGNLP